MIKNIFTLTCLELLFITGYVFASLPQIVAHKQENLVFLRPGLSFYDLVMAEKLDDSIFSNREKLSHFSDVNRRNHGSTPLHILIKRPDATIEQIKFLLDCGANINIPALVEIHGQTRGFNSHTTGFSLTGDTPSEMQEDRSSFNQYLGNPEVVNYIFQVMLEQKITKEIERAKQANELHVSDDGAGYFILPSPSVKHNWPEMPEDEARKYLLASIKDQKEFEQFLNSITHGAFEQFLKIEKNK